MRNLNFLPKWYIDKKYNTVNKLINILNIMMIIICICLLILIQKNYLDYKGLSRSQKETNKSIYNFKELRKDEDSISNKDMQIINIYKETKKEIGSRVFDSLEINNNEVKVKILHSSFEDYIALVKSIENGEVFEVIDIQPPIEKDNLITNLITIKYIK